MALESHKHEANQHKSRFFAKQRSAAEHRVLVQTIDLPVSRVFPMPGKEQEAGTDCLPAFV